MIMAMVLMRYAGGAEESTSRLSSKRDCSPLRRMLAKRVGFAGLGGRSEEKLRVCSLR